MKLKIRLEKTLDEDEKCLAQRGMRTWYMVESELTVPVSAEADQVSQAVLEATKLLVAEIYQR
jgi:hypothetical protein